MGSCGCEWVGRWGYALGAVRYCSLHAAAPDLLAALEALCDAPAVPDVYSDLWGDANAALDKAKGTDVGA